MEKRWLGGGCFYGGKIEEYFGEEEWCPDGSSIASSANSSLP
jgi:hypothetical protein